MGSFGLGAFTRESTAERAAGGRMFTGDVRNSRRTFTSFPWRPTAIAGVEDIVCPPGPTTDFNTDGLTDLLDDADDMAVFETVR